MSDYEEDASKGKNGPNVLTTLADIVNPLGGVPDFEAILSNGLDKPDWHLKYARNIIYAILTLSALFIVQSFYYSHSADYISSSTRAGLLVLIAGVVCICGIFDGLLDQESTEVHWFNYARFWFVLLTVGSLTLYIAMLAINTVANF